MELQGIISAQIGDNTLRVEIEELNDIYIEVAKRELRETPECKTAAIVELRELLKGKSKFSYKEFE